MGKFTAYKLPLRDMTEGKHVFEYKLDKEFFKNMENEDVHDADLTATLNVNYHNDVYDLDFDVEGEVTLLCDRCLDALQWPISQKYHIVVKYGDGYCDDSDEELEIPRTDPDINVAYMLHDTVVLGIPIRHVHPAGKCNRQMSALFRRHASNPDPDSELEENLMEEIDDIDRESPRQTDPRWNALKGLGSDAEVSED